MIAREEERRRIQRDLHDGLGPQLTAVSLELDAARNHLDDGRDDRAVELLGSARQSLVASVADVRRLVYSLGDPTLASLGLRSAVTERVEQLSRGAGVATTLDIDDLPDLSAAQEEAVSMIVAEAMTNVVRHADARQCSVRIGTGGSQLLVSVTDDGIGINGNRPSGIGTRSMQERASELGGAVAITSTADGGTTVQLTLPLLPAAVNLSGRA